MLRGKYRIPFYMSTDCENLLKRFLVLNPGKRGTLEVRTHLKHNEPTGSQASCQVFDRSIDRSVSLSSFTANHEGPLDQHGF